MSSSADPALTFDNSSFLGRVGATDLSSGFGSDSFLSKNLKGSRKPFRESSFVADPWGRKCFMSLVDAAINHEDFYFPYPSADYSKGLPESIRLLIERKVLKHLAQAVPETKTIDPESILAAFKTFSRWARGPNYTPDIRDWVRLQYERGRLGMDVQREIREIWTNNPLLNDATRLAKDIGVTLFELEYAFSVMFRGQAYAEKFGRAVYFPHPLKQLILKSEEIHGDPEAVAWSWGRLLARQIESGELSGDMEDVFTIIASLRDRVKLHEATWYALPTDPQEREEVLTTVAKESALPAHLKPKVNGLIQATMSAIVALTGPAAPQISATLGAATAVIFYIHKGYVSEAVVKSGLLQGVLEWPGLFTNKKGMEK